MESWVAEELLDECTRAGVLLHQVLVLNLELVHFVGLDSDLALKLADVLCVMSATVLKGIANRKLTLSP